MPNQEFQPIDGIFSGISGKTTYIHDRTDLSDSPLYGPDNYLCQWNGPIYVQQNNQGKYIPINQEKRLWRGMTTLGHDIYACEFDGDIYWKDAHGDFKKDEGSVIGRWTGIAGLSVAPDHPDSEGCGLYACTWDGGIYKRVDGIFKLIFDEEKLWSGMVAHNGVLYVLSVLEERIYKMMPDGHTFTPTDIELTIPFRGVESLGTLIYDYIPDKSGTWITPSILNEKLP